MTTLPLLKHKAELPCKKPALLLSHSFFSSHNHLLPNMGLVQQSRLIRVDLPGHGHSAPPQLEAEDHPQQIVRQWDHLRQHLGIAAWHVCCQSFGAGLALRFAPDLRARLVENAARFTLQTLALLVQEALLRLSVVGRLAQLAPPCQLINGTKERQFQPVRNWLSVAFPDIAIDDLPGGHSISIECATGSDAAASGFVQRLDN